MEEVEATRRRVRGGGLLNTIVMNAVLEACVRCGDVDRALRLFEEMRGPNGCGVDGVSYGILLKVWYLLMHATLTLAKTRLLSCLFQLVE